MTEKYFYPAIDRFKLLAAFLVIAIHTSPLTSLSPEADYILTRVLARTAVPFFFMVTGYFVLPKALEDRTYGFAYLKRIGLIYLVSVVLYLPVGIYAGHFKGAGIISVLKMIFLDGTFYHLWYLPALLLGFALLLLLLRALPFKAAGAVCVLLYLAGLFGDSYYGLIGEKTFVYTIYQGLFHIFEYTRNGLFYTPVFLLLGYAAARRRPSFALSIGALGVSFGFLLGEGILLKLMETQRHDSMYLFLLPVMYFLFSALLEDCTGEQRKTFPKDLPLYIYLLHPLFIILVRGGAKVTRLSFFVDNSLLHYLAVAVSTLAGALILTKLSTMLPKKNKAGKKTSAKSKTK
ncbi:serine/alanine racemase [Lachnospiraceae bacterium]|nr:serine/alanine racemase [Lachnospiraceae bacterium]